MTGCPCFFHLKYLAIRSLQYLFQVLISVGDDICGNLDVVWVGCSIELDVNLGVPRVVVRPILGLNDVESVVHAVAVHFWELHFHGKHSIQEV